MSAVDTASVSPDNPLRERVAAAVRAAAVRRHHPGALPRGAARGHGRAAGRGRRDRRLRRAADLREHRRGAGAVGPAAGAGGGGVRQPRLVGVHAAACGRSSGRSPRWRPRTPTPSASTRRCSPGSTPCTRPGTTPGLDDEAVRLVERYHLDFVLAGAQLDDAGRARLTELNQELSTLSTTFGQNLQLATRGRRRAGRRRRRARRARRRGDRRGRRRPPPTAGVDGLPARPAAAHRPAGARQAAQPGPAPPGVRGVDRPGVRRASTTTGRSPRGSPGCGPSGPGCSGSTPTPTSCWPTPPPAPPRRSTRCWPRWCPASVANAEAEAAVLAEAAGARRRRAGAPGTGRSTASRCAPSGTPSTPPALRPYFELDRVLVDGVFHAAELLYGYRFAPRPDLRRLPPRRPGVGGQRRRRRRGRAVPRRLLRPRGQARRGLDELVRPPVAAARHPAGRGQQPQRLPGRRPGSRRC